MTDDEEWGMRLVAGGALTTQRPVERAPASWVKLATGLLTLVALAAFTIFVL